MRVFYLVRLTLGQYGYFGDYDSTTNRPTSIPESSTDQSTTDYMHTSKPGIFTYRENNFMYHIFKMPRDKLN